jgi:hypothetical protein
MSVTLGMEKKRSASEGLENYVIELGIPCEEWISSGVVILI